MSVVEFGLIAPVFCLLLMGALDMGHSLYMQSVLQGVMQKAARDSTLESASAPAQIALINSAVDSQVLKLAKNGTVQIRRTAFRDYKKATNRAKEPFTDTNNNGTCDDGEPYEDNNNSGLWDIDDGIVGSGGAKDAVLLSATVSYPRLFPMAKLAGLPGEVTLNASTVLVNQPYGEQKAPKIGNCP
ncbi:MAG: TadE/TadG family type IV pilus assembly protein [Sphingobium sp.]